MICIHESRVLALRHTQQFNTTCVLDFTSVYVFISLYFTLFHQRVPAFVCTTSTDNKMISTRLQMTVHVRKLKMAFSCKDLGVNCISLKGYYLLEKKRAINHSSTKNIFDILIRSI